MRSVATYTEVVASKALAYDATFADEAWRPDGTGTFPTKITFEDEADAGCTVTVAARFPDARALQRAVELQMAEGYAEALDRLGDLLNHTD